MNKADVKRHLTATQQTSHVQKSKQLLFGWRCWVIVTLTLSLRLMPTCSIPFPECDIDERLDVLSFSCIPCSNGALQSSKVTACSCEPGWALFNIAENGTVQCALCKPPQVVTMDGRACITCDGNDTQIIDGKCACLDPRSIPVEQDINGAWLSRVHCKQCDVMHTPSIFSGIARCAPCPDRRMRASTTSGPCQCPDDFITVQGVCIPEDIQNRYRLRQADTTITFPRSQQTMYNREIGACNAYLDLLADVQTSQHGWISWPQQLPWLYFNSDSSTLKEVSIPFDDLQGAHLRFWIVVTDAMGNIYPLQDVGALFQPCGAEDRSWEYLGNNFQQTCSLTLAELRAHLSALQSENNIAFFEMFVQTSQTTLAPIPVEVLVTSGSDPLPQFVRRFFLLDEVSGASDDQGMDIVRYLEKISIFARIQPGHRILDLPKATATYRDIPRERFISSSLPFQFVMRYHLPQRRYNRALMGLTITYSIISLFVAVLRASSFSRRNFVEVIDETWLRVFIGGYLRTLGSLMFWTVIGASFFWLITYRGQQEFFMQLPIGGQDSWLPPLLLTGKEH